MHKQSIAAVALALVGLPAMAESGFYTGVGVARVTLKDNIAGFELETSDTGFKVFGGYRFNEYGSLELAYIDATPEDTVSGVAIESDAWAIQGSAIYQVPITARFEGFARVGFLAWDTENTATAGPIVLTEDVDGVDWSLGIGAAFHVTPSFSLRAEYEGAELEGIDFRALSINGVYRF